MSGQVGGMGGDASLDRATAEADRLAASQTAKAEQLDIRQDVAKERMQDFLSERGDLLRKDQNKKKKDLKKDGANRIRRGQMGGDKMGGDKMGKGNMGDDKMSGNKMDMGKMGDDKMGKGKMDMEKIRIHI